MTQSLQYILNLNLARSPPLPCYLACSRRLCALRSVSRSSQPQLQQPGAAIAAAPRPAGLARTAWSTRGSGDPAGLGVMLVRHGSRPMAASSRRPGRQSRNALARLQTRQDLSSRASNTALIAAQYVRQPGRRSCPPHWNQPTTRTKSRIMARCWTFRRPACLLHNADMPATLQAADFLALSQSAPLPLSRSADKTCYLAALCR